MLKEEYGAQYVLNSSSETFFDEIRELAKQLGATSCIECVGGKFTARLMECLPSRSTVILYGCLSEQDIDDISPLSLIGKANVLETFVLTDFLQKQGMGILDLFKRLGKLMADGTFQSEVQKTFKMSEFQISI